VGGRPDERLRWKEPLHSLQVELRREFGLSPVCSRALIRRLEEFLDAQMDGQPASRGPGQIRYPAVALGERAGKPVRLCRTIPVALTWLHPGDAEALHTSGSPALRQLRLARLCTEAYRQGAVLSHEDLSLLLGVEVSTVRRLARACAEGGEQPQTRGRVEDIGRTTSHKEQVLRLYLRGLLPARIAARTGHSLGSVERYLSDFARVAELLLRRRLPVGPTVRITGMSPALVRRYAELLEPFDRPEHRAVLDRLLRRFGPLEAAPSARARSKRHG
jgi:hypothetical protein